MRRVSSVTAAGWSRQPVAYCLLIQICEELKLLPVLIPVRHSALNHSMMAVGSLERSMDSFGPIQTHRKRIALQD
jgi:hypothetical protein